MININFFRKEKKNILPVFLVLAFLVAAAGIAVQLYFARDSKEATLAQYQSLLQENVANVELSQEIMNVDQWVSQSVEVQNILLEKQFPMNYLTEDLASYIPDESSRVSSFQLAEGSDQVSIVLENTDTTEALKIVKNLEERPYINAVQFLSAEAQSEGEERPEHRFNLIIELNLEALLEEVAK